MRKVDPAVPKPQAEVQPYERPRIISREKLEVVAAVCSPGKAPGGPGADCFLNANS